MDDFNNKPVRNFIRRATAEIVTPEPAQPPLPVYVPQPVKIVPAATYSAPVYVAQPTPVAQPMAAVAQVGSTVITESINLPADVSNFYSNGQSYFALAGEGGASTDWYQYPTQTGNVIFDPVGGGPQKNLTATGSLLAYDGQSLMPSTWYLNSALNGVIKIANDQPQPVPVFNQGQIYAGGNDLFYNTQSLMPATWYLNPSLNGEILLEDASGTQLLHSIDANLYYNNELLAKANDIQDIADWSLYPALASVDFDANSITGLADITATGAASVGTLTTTGLATLESINVTGTLAGPVGGTVDAGINTNTSGILTSGLSTNPAIAATTDSVTTSQIIFDICGGTLATDGGGTLLTFNGQAITTGTEGDAANWSTYPAFNDITGVTTEPLVIRAPGSQPLNIIADNNAINSTTGGAYNVTVDKGLNIVAAANVNITAQNGSGGNIALNAQPGYQLGNQQIGFGAIQLNAFGSSNQVLGLGGKIDINAYSGGLGEYGSATSRVSVSSATIALSAGAVPTLPGTAGAMNIFGQDIISIVASLLPPVLPQFPQTVYIYGDGISNVAGGVRLSSPNGVQLADNSELYATDIYPYTSNGLNLKGRASIPGPAADVTIADCASFDMRNAGTMTGIQSITMTGTGLVSGVQSLTLTGTGGITGVATINGVAYPPPVGDVADWSTFPALQNVDISGYVINAVGSINLLTNSAITSAGTLGIFSDGGDLSIASTNTGNVSIGTGNQGDISILTAGAGNDLSLGGDTATLTAQTAITINSNAGNTTIDGNNITNNALANFTASATTGTADINGQTGVSIYAATNNVNLVADSGEVIVQDSVLNMNTHQITNLVAGVNPTDAVNLAQLTTVITSKDTTDFYVADNGSDVSGNGSFFAPFATIQTAITAAELVSSNINVCVIYVASGHYNENLTFTKGYIVLNGAVQSQTLNEVVEITGSISIALTGTDDVFVRQVAFNGFNITHGPGQAVTDTSVVSHTVSFQDCKIFAYQQSFVSTAACNDMRLYMTNVEIQQTYLLSTSPVIVTNLGQAEFERLDLVLTGNGQGILIGGTSILARLSLSVITSTNPSATLAPLLAFTTNTVTSHSIGNTAFAFTSATAKTNTSAMYINTGVATAIIFLNNVFTLAGTASSTNFCVGYDGSGNPTLAGFANTSLNVNVLLPQTTAVQTGITQIQYTNIQPPGLATYSSTADQPIAVSGTPQALTYNTTQFNQGTTLVANSRVYVNAQGNYALSYSVELQHTGGGPTQIATTFLKKNGTTIANTGRQWSITSGSFQNAAMAEFVVSLNAGDYVEVFFSGDTSLSANATAAAGALPAIPSVVFNVKQFR